MPRSHWAVSTICGFEAIERRSLWSIFFPLLFWVVTFFLQLFNRDHIIYLAVSRYYRRMNMIEMIDDLKQAFRATGGKAHQSPKSNILFFYWHTMCYATLWYRIFCIFYLNQLPCYVTLWYKWFLGAQIESFRVPTVGAVLSPAQATAPKSHCAFGAAACCRYPPSCPRAESRPVVVAISL